ncbi:MAG: LysM peptidoglycan-binding domain-containing protein [Ruminococcaceae bacterium]|nr:LysM peptidoglycan-binding domain-containing protein [Oscillospiraceae bacterium]
MVIYTVKQGDSLYSIAAAYGTTAERIAADNLLTNPGELVIGQTLVIYQPLVSYRVRNGDTLFSIARQFGTSTNALWRNNPSLVGKNDITPGKTLNIVLPETLYGRVVESGAYVYANVSREVLQQTLPYLTYLTIFTYGFRDDGTLIDIDDGEIVELARSYGVAPVMHLSSLNERGTFSSENAARIFQSESVQDKLLDEVERIVTAKRYEAVDVDFEYLEGQYADRYVAFIRRLRERMAPLGIEVFVALAPKYSADQEGLLYEGHDYRGMGEAADGVILMTYEWGYSRGEPQAVAPIDKVRRVVEYATTVIPREKIFLGTPNYGYDWRLPFVAGESVARSLSNAEAVARAWEKNAIIDFDEVAQSPSYNYYERENGRPVEHVVWFEDARSVAATMALIEEFSLRGFFVWNAMRYFPSLWSVANNSFPLRRYFQ